MLATALIAALTFAASDRPSAVSLVPPETVLMASETGGTEGGTGGAPSPGWLHAHRALEWATLGVLTATSAAGVILTINQSTLLGDGRCTTGDPIFGSYGCNGFNILHGVLGVSTAVLYTATRLTEGFLRDTGLLRPGPIHRALSWVHLVGMILQPLLGISGSNPQLLGITHPDNARRFSNAVRTVHAGVGVITLGAFAASTLIDVRF